MCGRLLLGARGCPVYWLEQVQGGSLSIITVVSAGFLPRALAPTATGRKISAAFPLC